MAIAQYQQDNLFKAFGLFIEAFRPYVVEILQKEAGERWPAWFVEALQPQQRENWNNGLKQGSKPEALIDYPYLKSFALKYKDLLKDDFGKDLNKLATRLQTIYDVRNKLAHFTPIEEDEFAEALIQMKQIARAIKMDELETELARLQESKPQTSGHDVRFMAEALAKPVPAETHKARPWFMVVTPHMDIRQGRLDESIFAANLAEVALGNGREIYNNPVVFFSKTFFTAGLKSVAKTVIKGLNGNEDAENRVISLQTGFGGGKTHTLISLYHLCKWGRKAAGSASANELLAHTGIPEFETARIAVFTNTTNDPAQGRTTPEGIVLRTMWGELAWQLGGAEAYNLIKKNDEERTAPHGIFQKVIDLCKPALILIDELADYCLSASAQVVGASNLGDQTISFIQQLTEAVAGTNHCVAVITLPASPQEVGNSIEAHAILTSLQKRVSRIGADTQPVSDEEIYEVIRRRLFEDMGDPEMIEQAIAQYMEMYRQFPFDLPGHVAQTDYRQKMLKSYPFHPELIDVFRIRWASHHDFQRTRGALRLLAAIVSDLYKRQQSLPGSNLLIHAGQANFINIDALSGQLKRLYGNEYDSVITADVAGGASNAFKIDGTKKAFGEWYLAQSVTSVILMNSFGSEGAKKGISVAELKLNLIQPGGFNHNEINSVLDELEANAHYLYYAQTGAGGKRYWFHTKPNIKVLINQVKADYKDSDIVAEILRRLTEKTRNTGFFNVLVNPSEDLPEQQKPTLLILSPAHTAGSGGIAKQTLTLIEKLATKKGNSERIYRNTLLFLLADENGFRQLSADIREYLACHKINSHYQQQLEKEDREELRKRLTDINEALNRSLVTAFSIVAKFSVMGGLEQLSIRQFKSDIAIQIGQQITETLKEEEWLLDNIGLGTLRSHNLMPAPGKPVKVRDVYEAFIRFDDKPMITGIEAVARSLQRYCTSGEYCIAAGDGKQFTRYFYREQVPFFDVTDQNYWLVDKADKPLPQPIPVLTPPEPSGQTTPIPAPGQSLPIPVPDIPKVFNAVKVAGKIPVENYAELFSYFIAPFTMNGNKVEIEVSFTIKSNASNPLEENKPAYKNLKEAAKQLGLRVEEE